MKEMGLPDATEYSSVLDVWRKESRQAGIFSLWRGNMPNVKRASLVQLGDLVTYDITKGFLTRDRNWEVGQATERVTVERH